MANCYLCEKKLGMLSKVRHMDGHRFCESCADLWPEERKNRALSLLCKGGDPVEIFTVPRVKCASPDYPKNRTTLLGNLAFTDKGVCFIQVAESRRADPGWGVMFGLIGAAAAGSAAKKREQRALAQGESAVLQGAQSFRELLDRSPRLMLIPAEEIRDVTWSWMSGFTIKTATKPRRFFLAGGKQSYKAFQARIAEYVRAVQLGMTPTAGSQSHPPGLV